MTEEMEKVDAIRDRTGASYRDAYQALMDCDGNVIEAIIRIEEKRDGEREEGFGEKSKYYVKGSQLVDKVKDIIHQGNVTRIRIRKEEEILLDFPVTIGVVGALVAPYLVILGGIATLVSHATIEVERKEDEEEEEDGKRDGIELKKK